MAKILLIDDDKDLVAAYTMMLKSKGHQVSAAYSAVEARRLSPGDHFDLVVLDVMMESLTAGFELAREMHEHWPRLPIVMVSAIRDATHVPFHFEPDDDWLPVLKFIEKPTDPQLVINQVEELLESVKGQ
jgi:DNA-binding NtrC family response regulator